MAHMKLYTTFLISILYKCRSSHWKLENNVYCTCYASSLRYIAWHEAPLKAIVGERMNDWRKHHVTQLGKTMLEMTGDYTPDVMALLSADIIISTPEKWDGISRNWHRRSYVTKVGLVILDEIHLLGVDRGPILEFATSDEHPRQFLSVTGEVLQTVLSQVTDQNLRHTVRFGIGLHHAGLND